MRSRSDRLASTRTLPDKNADMNVVRSSTRSIRSSERNLRSTATCSPGGGASVGGETLPSSIATWTPYPLTPRVSGLSPLTGSYTCWRIRAHMMHDLAQVPLFRRVRRWRGGERPGAVPPGDGELHGDDQDQCGAPRLPVGQAG